MSVNQICQSCGMPLNKDGDFGTNLDKTLNGDYCGFCYQNGEFTNPDLTLDQQMERLVEMAKEEMNMPGDMARETAKKVLPNLKRWKS